MGPAKDFTSIFAELDERADAVRKLFRDLDSRVTPFEDVLRGRLPQPVLTESFDQIHDSLQKMSEKLAESLKIFPPATEYLSQSARSIENIFESVRRQVGSEPELMANALAKLRLGEFELLRMSQFPICDTPPLYRSGEFQDARLKELIRETVREELDRLETDHDDASEASGEPPYKSDGIKRRPGF